jgi:hypothetical protein
LVLWSSQSLQKLNISYFPIIYLIWSSGPHEIYKSRYCSFSTAELIWSFGPHKIYEIRHCYTFLLFISFGPLVLTKFTRVEIALLFYCLSLFGPLVPTKFTRAETALFFYCEAKLILWSSQNLREQRLPYFPSIYLIWCSGPHEIYKHRECSTFLLFISFGPLVLTKFTSTENAALSYYLSHLVLWSSRNLLE